MSDDNGVYRKQQFGQKTGLGKSPALLVVDFVNGFHDPEILGGIPVFVGTRVPVQNLFDYLEAGDRIDDFIDEFPSVTREQAIAALESARAALVDRAGHSR